MSSKQPALYPPGSEIWFLCWAPIYQPTAAYAICKNNGTHAYWNEVNGSLSCVPANPCKGARCSNNGAGSEKDCRAWFDGNFTESGVYCINPAPSNIEPFEVYCDMSDGGGWTVIQRWARNVIFSGSINDLLCKLCFVYPKKV